MRIKKYSQLYESKSIGNIYHYTSLPSLISILINNVIYCSEDSTHVVKDMGTIKDHKYFISFTRNKNLHSMYFELGENQKAVRIKLDGTKISMKYKFISIDEFHDSPNINYNYESEERLIFKTKKGDYQDNKQYYQLKNIKDYILSIDINKEYLKIYGIDPSSIRKLLEMSGEKPKFDTIVDIFKKFKRENNIEEYLNFIKPILLNTFDKNISVNLF